MNGNQYFAGRYQEVGVNTSTPVHLVVMLYDAAIRSLDEARVYMELKDISGRSRSINKCSAIISELQSSLNLSEGGEIATSLNRLYDYVKMTLLRAGMEQNPALLVEVSGLLESLHSAWKQIDSGAVESSPEFDGAGFHGNPQVVESGLMGSFSISA